MKYLLKLKESVLQGLSIAIEEKQFFQSFERLFQGGNLT